MSISASCCACWSEMYVVIASSLGRMSPSYPGCRALHHPGRSAARAECELERGRGERVAAVVAQVAAEAQLVARAPAQRAQRLEYELPGAPFRARLAALRRERELRLHAAAVRRHELHAA